MPLIRVERNFYVIYYLFFLGYGGTLIVGLYSIKTHWTRYLSPDVKILCKMAK